MKINENGIVRDMTPEEIEFFNIKQADATVPTQQDRFEAQLLYTALMTDTLLEE